MSSFVIHPIIYARAKTEQNIFSLVDLSGLEPFEQLRYSFAAKAFELKMAIVFFGVLDGI